MARVQRPDTFERLVDDLITRIERLERMDVLGQAATQAGTSIWADANGTTQITIGLESDGTYGIWVGNALKIVATGANAGQILGLVISTIAGNLSISGSLTVTGATRANGGLTAGGATALGGTSVTGALTVSGDASAGTISAGGSKYTITNTGNTRLDITTH